MRKTLIALAVVLAATSAQAQQRYHRDHGGGYHHNRGGGWVAPLIGGMVLGGVLYGLNQPSYAAPQPQYQRVCGYEPVYDIYGRYMGDRRVCNTIPLY